MNDGTDPMQTDADVQRPRVATLLDEKIKVLMHTTPPTEQEHENYGSDADVMVTVAQIDIRSLIAEDVDCSYAQAVKRRSRTESRKPSSM